MAISLNRRQHIRFSPKAVPGVLEAWYAPYLGGFNVGTLGTVSTLPDLSGRGRHLTNGTEAFSPYLGTGTGGNMARQSDDFTTASFPNTATTIWVPTNVTVNSASTFTFGLLNGNIIQSIRYIPNKVYTVTFNAQKITGNTALKFVGTNSVEGDQNLTLTTTLDPYSFTVTAPNTFAGAALSLGFKDPNASLFGQIKVTNFQVRESGWATGYVATGNQIIRPGFNGKPVLCLGQGTITSNVGILSTAAFTLNQPWTLYMLVRINFGNSVQSLLCDGLKGGTNNTGGIFLNTGATALIGSQAATGLGGQAITAGSWGVITAVFNGTNSLFQINRTVPFTGDVGANNPGGFTLGCRADGARECNFDFLECIIRRGADDAQQRNTFQLYLADVAGLSI